MSMPRPRGKGREAAHDGRSRQNNQRASLKSAWAEGNYDHERSEGASDAEEDQQQVNSPFSIHPVFCNVLWSRQICQVVSKTDRWHAWLHRYPSGWPCGIWVSATSGAAQAHGWSGKGWWRSCAWAFHSLASSSAPWAAAACPPRCILSGTQPDRMHFC